MAVGRVTVGDRVAIVCDEGYQNAGDAYAECLADQTYSASGECMLITCGPYPVPEHARADPSGGVAYMGSVNVSCDVGYAGGWDAKCRADGTYDEKGECVGVTCPPYPAPPHASATPGGAKRVASGRVVEITCDPGYVPRGGVANVTVVVICGPDGVYGGEEPDCVQIQCGPLAPPEHGNVSQAGGVNVGSQVVITCEQGYEPSGASGGRGGAVVRECQPDGFFPGPEVECVRVCPPFPAVSHGAASPKGRTHQGDEVVITCSPGFTVSVPGGSAICDDGAYSPPVITCNKAKQCPPYPAPANGYVRPAGKVRVGNHASVVCDEGYKLSPNSTSSPLCIDGGVFDVPEAVCEPVKGCPPYPPVVHGSVTPDTPLKVGDQVCAYEG